MQLDNLPGLVQSIAPTFGSLERDVRFIFCACSISYILNDWSGINMEATVRHIKQLQVGAWVYMDVRREKVLITCSSRMNTV